MRILKNHAQKGKKMSWGIDIFVGDSNEHSAKPDFILLTRSG
jgi:hypothetical protein